MLFKLSGMEASTTKQKAFMVVGINIAITSTKWCDSVRQTRMPSREAHMQEGSSSTNRTNAGCDCKATESSLPCLFIGEMLEEMIKPNMPIVVHGEVINLDDVDILDHENAL
ncbi:hypothetical protein POM88_004887 [Heracleum sosnowskyi]|uniref:Uncharacterized protein n=1 Tax=Heracleum sosnowskyi TaxID=360622 RepID=A0AAD8JMM2_9APIA|nr:hypothetical protein POM88_004887 [Heracleum sosnowskyi]